MPQQKLDLLQFAPDALTQPSAGAPQIMWSELREARFSRIFLYNVPDHLFRHFGTADRTLPGDPSEKFALRHASRHQPIIDRLLDPIGNWNRSNVATLSNEVHVPCFVNLPKKCLPEKLVGKVSPKTGLLRY